MRTHQPHQLSVTSSRTHHTLTTDLSLIQLKPSPTFPSGKTVVLASLYAPARRRGSHLIPHQQNRWRGSHLRAARRPRFHLAPLRQQDRRPSSSLPFSGDHSGDIPLISVLPSYLGHALVLLPLLRVPVMPCPPSASPAKVRLASMGWSDPACSTGIGTPTNIRSWSRAGFLSGLERHCGGHSIITPCMRPLPISRLGAVLGQSPHPPAGAVFGYGFAAKDCGCHLSTSRYYYVLHKDVPLLLIFPEL